ncbi:hypothetical protein IWX47DRAFT_883045 [Phyllosticta citricarpa]
MAGGVTASQTRRSGTMRRMKERAWGMGRCCLSKQPVPYFDCGSFPFRTSLVGLPAWRPCQEASAGGPFLVTSLCLCCCLFACFTTLPDQPGPWNQRKPVVDPWTVRCFCNVRSVPTRPHPPRSPYSSRGCTRETRIAVIGTTGGRRCKRWFLVLCLCGTMSLFHRARLGAQRRGTYKYGFPWTGP